MAVESDHQGAAVEAVSSSKPKDPVNPTPTSPAQSDKSSESEGKPVREKLKETRIDAQSAPDSGIIPDHAMNDIQNGSAKAESQSASGSDNERGRLKKKRSHEDFEKDDDVDKQSEKEAAHDKSEPHHARKRSRETKDIANEAPVAAVANKEACIEEKDADEKMSSPAKVTSNAKVSHSGAGTDTSPKNKRTREQAEITDEESVNGAKVNGKPVSVSEDERDSKRPKERSAQSTDSVAESESKIPPGSGFADTSVASPFASVGAKPQASKIPSKSDTLPQTSEEDFKASGFGSFANAEISSFSGLASTGSKSPFGTAGGAKLTSFAGSTDSPSSPAGGFAMLSGSSKSGFGASTFGSSLGGGFGSLAGSKPGLSSFATPADLTIKGLKAKPSAFGTPADQDISDESGDDDEDGDETEKEGTDDDRRSSQPLLSQQPQETGEEGEHTVWTGRAKLYTMGGEGSNKGWKERGIGTFKLNVTIEEPKKARFVLRADGTHRLLLNVAITRQLKFGDSNGSQPKDGRLLFNAPTSSGEVEMHLLKLRVERASELWDEVQSVQETDL